MYKDPTERSIVVIMKKDDKYMDEARNTLSGFIRKILANQRNNMQQLSKQVDAWTLTRYAANDKLRSSAKSNILKAIAGNDASWNTFLRFCQIMNFQKVIFTLQVVRENGLIDFYQETINNDHLRPSSSEDSDGDARDMATVDDIIRRLRQDCAAQELQIAAMRRVIQRHGLEAEVRVEVEYGEGV